MLQHVSDHKGSIIRELYTVLGRKYSDCSNVPVDMDIVGVMAAYLPVVRVCTALSRETKHCIRLPDDGSLVIRNMLE